MAKLTGIVNNTSMVNFMSQLAADNNAVNLANDFSDFACPDGLLDVLISHIREGHNKYAPSEGIAELRNVISAYIKEFSGYRYDPETEVTVTAGATQAIFTAISSIVREGDEVIVFEPAYETYIPAIESKGARPVFIQLKANDFSIDWCNVQKMITTRTKLIILSTPHNLSGAVLTDEDFDKLQKIVNGTKIMILSDESFGDLYHNPADKRSIACYPKLAERAVVVGSLSKSLCVPGWKIGYCLAPAAISAEVRIAHSYQVYSVNLPMQYAMADYVGGRTALFPYLEQINTCKALFASLMADSSYTLSPTSGGYFQVLGYEKISTERDVDFVKRLAKDYGVTAMPMSVFYHDSIDNKQLRVCIGKTEEEIRLAAEYLKKVK